MCTQVVEWVCVCRSVSIPTSSHVYTADSSQATVSNVLTQTVSGEWVTYIAWSFVKSVHVKCPTLSTDRPEHLMLFRTHVSRTAAGKGRAVLEGVGLMSTAISACFTSHPQNEEEAVQAGLIKWIEGQGRQPPTWAVLVKAMKYAQIAQQHVQSLKEELGLSGE